MSADVFRELLRDFRAAEAEWPVKGYTRFKIWARTFLNNGRPEPGWLARYNEKYEEWHLASFRVDSREWGYHIFTHIGCVDDEKPVERFTELATKAGAHLSLYFQNQISPKPKGSLDWWLALMWRLSPADDTEYGDKPRIFLDDPFFESANVIELCRLNTGPRGTNSPEAEPADNPKGIAVVGADDDREAETGEVLADAARNVDGEQQPNCDDRGKSGGNGQVRAHQHKLFSPDFPDDADMRDLAVRIDQAHGTGKGPTAIAREFTMEEQGSDENAQRLLARLRKQKQEKHYFPRERT